MEETYEAIGQDPEEIKDLTEILDIYRQALKKCGDNPGPVLFEMGKFLFTQGIYAEALEVFLKCHQAKYHPEEVENIIMEAYYQPNVEEFKINYQKNVEQLSQYPYIFTKDYPNFSELCYCFIPYSDTKFVIFDRKTRKFRADFDLKQGGRNYENFKANDTILIKNEFKKDIIMVLEKTTRDPEPFLWTKIPLYLYYEDFNEFIQYLQVCDFTELLKSERLVFLFGKNEIDEWFFDPQSRLTKYILNIQGENDDLFVHITEIFKKNETRTKSLQKEMDNYYNSLSKQDLLNHFKNGTPRILFISSRFTTALQYFTRDCILACDKLGIPNKLLIEKSDIHRNSRIELLLLIEEFRPDVIFIIDHFRWEYPFLPDNVIFATWLQDPLPHIMSPESVRKIKEMDFILNLFITSNEFLSLGYPTEKLINAVVPVNPYIYKTYTLTEQEKKEFGSDICVFSNAGNPQKALRDFLRGLSGGVHYNKIEKIFESVYQEIYKRTYQGKPLYTTEQYKEIILKWFSKSALSVNEEATNNLAETFRRDIGFRILRSVPLEWLHEKGFNIKLWGREWIEHPVLKKYAQGVAENGETLSKIINASKIVVGTNPGISAHPRVFESILSNGFYIGMNIPAPYDWANVRNLMEEGKEIVFFYSREDLYKKIDYYLEHEDERREIIANGQKKILADLTYESMMKRVIKEVTERMESQIMKKGGRFK